MPNALVQESFERCEAAGDFAEKFYAVFLNASPKIAPHFAATDFEKQRKLLRATVYLLVTRDVDDPQAFAALERIGRSHSRSELNIRPALYDLWLDSVCSTATQLDPDWTPELEAAWREQLRPGIEAITALY